MATPKATPADLVVQKTTKDLDVTVKQVVAMTVNSAESYAQAGDVLKNVKTYAKTFKAEKDRVLKPVKDMVKAYEATLKPTEAQLKELEATIKQKMLAYNEEQSAIAAREAAKLEAKIESGYIKNPETIMTNMAKIETVNNAQAGVTESMVTKVRVTDWSKIPQEYFSRPKVLEALMVEIRKDALGNKAQKIDPIAIPGTELYQEKQLSM